MRHSLLCWYHVLVILVGVAGCSPERMVEVDLTGLPGAVVSLNVGVQLPDQTMAQYQPVTRFLDRFYLALPVSDTGLVPVQVDGMGGDGCRIAAGHGSLKLSVDSVRPLTIQMTPQRDGCRISVQQVGDGSGQVSAQAAQGGATPVACGGPSAMSSAPAQPCGADGRSPFAAGQIVGLAAEAAPGSFFAGWSGPCTGTDACRVDVTAGPTQVTAAFAQKRVCEGAWCWDSPLPHGFDINALWGASANDVWAAGAQGTLLHWNGSFWVRWVPVTQENLNGIYGLPDAVPDAQGPRPLVWAVGDKGTILWYDGSQWTALDSPTRNALVAVWASGPADVWAVGVRSTLLHFDETGWNPAKAPLKLGLATVEAVWGTGTGEVWAAGEGFILHRNQGGDDWQVNYLNAESHILSLWGTSAHDIWAVGYQGENAVDSTTQPLALHLGADGTWSPQGLPDDSGSVLPVRTCFTVWGTATGDVWLSAGDRLFHFDGTAFSTLDGPGWAGASATALWGSGPNDVWSGGDGNTLLHWNGQSWSRRSGGFPGELTGISGTSAHDVYAVGHGSQVLHYDGANWTALPGSGPVDLNAVWAGPEGDLWGVGNAGNILLRDGRMPPPSPLQIITTTFGSLNGVWALGGSNAWAVGEGGMVLHLGLQGSDIHVDPLTSGTQSQLIDVWGSGIQDIWAVGLGGTILHSNDGATFSVLPSPTTGDLYGVWGSGPGDVWMAGAGPQNGVLLHCDQTLMCQFDPAPPPTPRASYLSTVWGDRQGTLWVSTEEAIWMRPAGGSWTLDSGLPITPVHMWGTDRRHLWAVSYDGTIISRSGGP